MRPNLIFGIDRYLRYEPRELLHIFHKQLHFRIEPQVANKMSKMSLKTAMKLLSIFGIEAQSFLNFDHFGFKYKENKQNLAKFPISGSKVAKNFRFEPRELLMICYDFRKSEPRRVQNAVDYEKKMRSELLRFSKI